MTSPRFGSFGGGLNPFGSGSLGNLGQYSDVGKSLADLAVYEASVAWGNGLLSDELYLAALQKAVTVTDPGTRDRTEAQNAVDDAVYRIGRQKANQAGLDSLVAFDQKSLALMNPDNLRYRSIADSLASELTQRRSRDYGVKVAEVNAGKGSTQSLLWVTATQKSLGADAPDADSWVNVASELTQRVASEQDAKTYQDFQMRRITPAKFLAYVQARRDSYDPGSPDFEDWSRKLEDATKTVRDDELAKKDAAFFNAYSLGHKSDGQYLKYLSDRIRGMDPTDPQLPEWKQRLTTAAFSVAEDELRFKVQTGKAPASKLVAFYQAYRRGLNPNSPEYRQITRAIMSLGGGSGGGGGGGGGRSGGATKGSGVAARALPKNISPKYTLDGVLGLLTVNPRADKKDRQVALAAFDANHTSLMNAVQRGDAQWVFYDPRRPGAVIPLRDADGKVVRNAKGQTIMVPGSAYLPTSGTALANLDMLEANYHSGLAGVALSHHDAVGYFKEIAKASNAVDAARLHAGQQVIRDNKDLYKQVQDGIDLAMKTGDWASAVNLSNMLHDRITNDLQTPGLDDTRRAQLDTMLTKLADNPLLPTDVDAQGRPVGGAIDWGASTKSVDPGTGKLVLTGVTLAPNWHLMLDKTDANGRPNWGLDFDTTGDAQTWAQEHVTVTTSYGGKPVRGEVKIGDAPANPMVMVNTPDGAIMTPGLGVRFVSYTDEHGKVVRAYSLDGHTWIKPEDGSIPVLDVNVPGLTKGVGQGGADAYVDANGDVVFQVGAGGAWAANSDYFNTHPGAMKFFNQDALDKPTTLESGRGGLGTPFTRDPVTGEIRWGSGAPGALMTIAKVGADGSVDLSQPAMQRLTSGEHSQAINRFGQSRERNIDRPDAVPFTPTGEKTRGPAAVAGQRNFDLTEADKPSLSAADRSFDRESAQRGVGAVRGPGRAAGGSYGVAPPAPKQRNVDRIEGVGLRTPPPTVPTLTPRPALPGLPTTTSRRYEGAAPPPLKAKAPVKPPVKKPVVKSTAIRKRRAPVVPKPVVRSPVDQTTAAKTGTSKAI